MEQEQIVQDLRFIKKAVDASIKYTIIPPKGYIAAGALGLLGPLLTYLMIGGAKLSNFANPSGWTIFLLSSLWLTVLVLAIAASAYFTVERARNLNIAPWNSLSARMFLSQIPQLAVSGLITALMAIHHHYHLIPAVWLLGWGLILFSFHYFTGDEHLIQSIIFLGLGIAACFCSGAVILVLLALGFGATNLVFGIRRLIADGNST